MGPVINDVQHAKIWAHIDGAPTPPPWPVTATEAVAARPACRPAFGGRASLAGFHGGAADGLSRRRH
jgi:hypothetical protein